MLTVDSRITKEEEEPVDIIARLHELWESGKPYTFPTGISESSSAGSILYNLSGFELNESFPEPLAITRDQILTLLHLDSLRENPILRSIYKTYSINRDLELEQYVLSEFASICDVVKIYVDRFRAEYIFTVFTDTNTYNDELMDDLLDKELAVLDRFPSLPITFHFLPYRSDSNSKKLVSEEAKLIFRG